MYYALFDLQTGNYMHTGRNSTSLGQLKDSLLSYIEPDVDDDERDDIHAMSVESIAGAWDFKIDQSVTKFQEDK